MATEVYIPKLGQTVEEVTIVRWLVADGTAVEPGQEILEVETDKAVFAVEASVRGVLHIGNYQEGQVVPVLTVVATIGRPDEPFAPVGTKVAAPGAAPATPATPGLTPAEVAEPAGRVFASPRARQLAAREGVNLSEVTPTGGGGVRVIERDVLAYLSQMPKATPVAQQLAAEMGVDLRTVTGSGPGGRITREDVERVVDERRKTKGEIAPSPEILERVPLKGVRAIIADRMATSVHTTARVTLLMEVDATELVNLRERLKAHVEKEWGFAPGYNDLLAKMVATALRQHPEMNARFTPEAIERLAQINIGMAVDTERGLLVPVIRDADKKSLRQFGQEFRALVERARNGKSLPDDLSGGTFTITNLGMYDVMAFTPVINLPEAAILGVGCITPRPVVRDGQIGVRQMLLLSLAFDHRVVDGAPAARFLQSLKALIEEPYLWLVT